MTFQNFITQNQNKRLDLLASLKRLESVILASETALPQVNKVVHSIEELMSNLDSVPDEIKVAAKQALLKSCGWSSIVKVENLTIPQLEDNFPISPIIADMLGETENVTVQENIVTTNEILPATTPSSPSVSDSSLSTEPEGSRPKRRTQAGFSRKVKEWSEILDNLNADNFESSIAQVDDEYQFWTEDAKFSSEQIQERLEEVIASWTSLDQDEYEPEENSLTSFDQSEDSEALTEYLATDLSSFEVEEDKEYSDEVRAIIFGEDIITPAIEESPVENMVESFLTRFKCDLSEAGLSDLQEEVIKFYGADNIPQELQDANFDAWEKLSDSSDDELEDSEDYEAINESEEDSDTEVNLVAGDVYQGDVPEEDELDEFNDSSITEDNYQVAESLIAKDNSEWQEAILSCETEDILKDWDYFIAAAFKSNPDSVTPETLEALETTRAKLDARAAQQSEELDKDECIANWIKRAVMTIDLAEIPQIYEEIKATGIIPTMQLVNALDQAKTRLTSVAKPAPTDEEIQAARESIENKQWVVTVAADPQPEPIQPEAIEPAKKANPFARKAKVRTEVVEEASASIGNFPSINTSGVFDFKDLQGKLEQHNRFDTRYILEPGMKLYSLTTKHVFEVITWEAAAKLQPMIAENVNELPVKTLHNKINPAAKSLAETKDLVVISDEQAEQFITQFRSSQDSVIAALNTANAPDAENAPITILD